VPEGTYALLTIPSKDEWTVMINKNDKLRGTSKYKQEEDQVRLKIKPEQIPFRERMTFIVSDYDDKSARINLEWEKVRISFTVDLKTDEQAKDNIDDLLGWRGYARSARYFLNADQFDEGLKYIDQALALDDEWYAHWIKAELLKGKGETKKAYAHMEKAKELGEKAKSFFFRERVDKALAEWSKK